MKLIRSQLEGPNRFARFPVHTEELACGDRAVNAIVVQNGRAAKRHMLVVSPYLILFPQQNRFIARGMLGWDPVAY